jgi:hypothetical protein
MATAVVLTVPGARDSIVIRIECAAEVTAVDASCIGAVPAVTVAAIGEWECFDDDRSDWDTADDPFDDEPPAIPW